MQFKIHAEREDGVRRTFLYDNEDSSLTYEDGTNVIQSDAKPHNCGERTATSIDTPVNKSTDVKTLKVSLGLSCNYECTYCSQRFVPHGDSTTQHDIPAFVEMLTSNLTSDPEKIEFWGGEPFVYWKTFKPLAEALREKYPNAGFLVITNGSLLDEEKNAWLDALGFSVGLSHDGPGYHARGLDPLDNPEQRAGIMDLIQRLAPQGRISINAMMHKDNKSRAVVQEWLEGAFGVGVPIGEGSFVDPYDEGGLASMLDNTADHYVYRAQAYSDIRTNKAANFSIVHQKIQEFIDSVADHRQSKILGQKCGMDSKGQLAVDLSGNVLTCQNVSAASTAPNGQPHKIGHITDLENVQLKTSTHWSKRSECGKCPVLQLCKGACMFLEGNLWDKACDGAFSDNIAFLAAGVEALTGFVPYYIDGDFREDRKDIFGLVNGIPETPTRKAFPIPVVSA